MNLVEFFDRNYKLQSWQQSFVKHHRTLLTGFSASIKSMVMANAYENTPDKYIILTDSQFHANELYDELSNLIGESKVYQFFSDDNIYAEFAIASKERTAYRLEAINFLLDENQTGFLIVPFRAMQTYLPSPENYSNYYLLLLQGDEYGLTDLVNLLSTSGYEKTQRVMSPGEFSQRGDIVDIYPLDADVPVRLEFFGDEIEAIRSFDVESQRSLDTLEKFELNPASDFILTPEEFTQGVNELIDLLKKIDNDKTKSYLEEIIASASHHYYHNDLRKFAQYFYEKPTSLMNYFPKNIQIFIDDFQKINEAHHKSQEELADFVLSEKTLERYVDGQEYNIDLMSKIRNYKPATFFSNFQKGLGNLKFDALYNFNQHSMQDFFGQMDLVYTEIDRFVRQGYTIVLAVPSEKFRKSLKELEIDFIETDKENIQEGKVNLINFSLSSGFNFLDEKLVVITEQELFGKARKKKARRLNITNAERLKDYNELEVGDYVVHKNHGIGKYLGLQTIEVSGVHRDYLTIQYQKGDSISVPVEHIDLLSKYSTAEGKVPKINRLNDGRWKRTLSSVSKQIEDISDDLIKLYATRQAQKGYAFASDDVNQEEFDNEFTYVETEDQLRSIDELKRDMERERPMDRLLVGDVGFGKTEVAMRGAFKAINEGKQVAVLVPTTVLAEQHYKTMTERFVNFGVNVQVISRFQTKSQQEKILEELKKGRIDLLIGTHRLLSKDVEFFDLGLHRTKAMTHNAVRVLVLEHAQGARQVVAGLLLAHGQDFDSILAGLDSGIDHARCRRQVAGVGKKGFHHAFAVAFRAILGRRFALVVPGIGVFREIADVVIRIGFLPAFPLAVVALSGFFQTGWRVLPLVSLSPAERAAHAAQLGNLVGVQRDDGRPHAHQFVGVDSQPARAGRGQGAYGIAHLCR